MNTTPEKAEGENKSLPKKDLFSFLGGEFKKSPLGFIPDLGAIFLILKFVISTIMNDDWRNAIINNRIELLIILCLFIFGFILRHSNRKDLEKNPKTRKIEVNKGYIGFGYILLTTFVIIIALLANPWTSKEILEIYWGTSTPTSIPPQGELGPCYTQTPNQTMTPTPDVQLRDNCIPNGWITVSSNTDKGELDDNSCWNLEESWYFTGLPNGISFTPSNSTNNVVRGVYVEIPKLTKQFTFTINIHKITASGSVAPFFFFGNYIPSDDGSIKGEFVTYFYDPTRSDITKVGNAYLTDLTNQSLDTKAQYSSEANYLPANTKVILSPVDETHYSIQIGTDNQAEEMFKSIPYQDGKILLVFGTKSTPNSVVDVTVNNLDLSQFESNK